MKKLNSKKGFSLFEMILVLAVIAFFTAAVAPSASTWFSQSKREGTRQDIDGLHQKAIQWLVEQGGSSYTGVSVSVPAKNKFGGTYAVAANATDSNKLDITLTAIEQTDGTALEAAYTDKATVDYDPVAKTLTVTF